MCTRTLWLDSGYGPIAGRNMDWAQSLGTNLWVLPAGAERTGIEQDPNPLKWVSKYASLVATTYDVASADGLNEKELAAQPFGVPDPARPNISMTIWRTLIDLKRGVYAFESSFSPDIVWVQFNKMDLGTSRKLDLTQENLVGDVTDRFVATPAFTFASA